MMEKIYWIYDEDSLEEINHNLKTYGGHVVTITAVPTKMNNYPFPLAHAFVVVNDPGHNEFPLEEGEETEMEKVYWVLDDNSLREVNRQLEKYDGHVATITAVRTTKGQDALAHAFVVAVYRRDKLPKKRLAVSYNGSLYETGGDM